MTKPQPDWGAPPFHLTPARQFRSHSDWWTLRAQTEHGISAFLATQEEGVESVFLDTHVTLEQLPAIITARFEQALQVRRLEDQVAELAERVNRLEAAQTKPKEITIQTFAPEPYELLMPIRVALEEDASGMFLASFFDVNIATSGETEQDAFDNIKNLILDVYDSLSNEQRQSPGSSKPSTKRDADRTSWQLFIITVSG
jgi:predicted RNase H-like HicB family nuclease